MPYAINGQISKLPIEGGIEITQEQYKQALSAIMGGGAVAIRAGELKLLRAEKRTVYSTEDGSKKEIPENDDTPEGYTETAKPSEWHVWDAKIGEWVEDTEAKEAAEAEALAEREFEEGQSLDTDYADLKAKVKSMTWDELKAYIQNATSTQAGARDILIKLALYAVLQIRRS